MADIQTIRVNNIDYNIKDAIARAGFAYAELVTSVDNLNQQHTNIVFYKDSSKNQYLGSVNISNLPVNFLTAKNGILTEGSVAIANPADGITDSTYITVEVVNGKPMFVFHSTTDGSSDAGVALTEVTLPVGANGEIALKSDVATVSTDLTRKFGGASYDAASQSMKFYPSTTKSGTPLDTVDMSQLSVDELSIASFNNQGVANITYQGGSSPGIIIDYGGDDSLLIPLDGTEVITDATQVGKAYYNNNFTPPRIEFYSADTPFNNGVPVDGWAPVFTLDASPFVKDAMVESVDIVDKIGGPSALVITWNSDAGIEPTSIPLTDIFNPSNYYSKTIIDEKFDALDIPEGVVVDNALSGTSTNPVQNKVIKLALDSIGTTLSEDVVHTISVNGGTPMQPTNGNVDITIPSAAWADVKPSGGVPKSDLASGVQTSLGKADSAIQGVKVNGTELTPDSSKKVDVTVPTKLSDLSADATHRLVTDTEKSTWNNKQNALTFDNVPTKSSANPVKSGGVYSALADLYDGYDSSTETLSFTFPTE